jgi:signal transduction histidine kinase
MVWYVYHDDSVAWREQLQKRGITIGASLASQSRDLILTDNQFALYTLVRDTLNTDKDIVYAFVLDAAGNVLVHTFDGGFPTDLLGKNEVPLGEPYHIQALQAENDTIQDVATPVLAGKAGMVRIGMSEAPVSAAVAEHIRNILLWVVLVLTLGLSIAYGLAHILTGPISRLAEAVRAVSRGDFTWRTPVWANDEIGSLGVAFKNMSDELKHKEEMRVRLLAKVIGVQEEERKRIARELHDETGQALTSLMVGLKFIEDSAGATPVRGEITKLRALAAQTLNEVHHLASDLRPSLLDDLGLFAAVQRYAEEYSEKMGLNVDCYVDNLGRQRLPSEVEVTFYRIIQEALTNVAKHAEASNVSIVLRYRDSSLVATVEDDGKGFNVDSVLASTRGNKLGLFGMYERISLIGGKLTIESKHGEGTTVFLETPLRVI